MKGLNKRALLSACMATVLLASMGFGPAAQAVEAGKSSQAEVMASASTNETEGDVTTSAEGEEAPDSEGEGGENEAAPGGESDEATEGEGGAEEGAPNESEVTAEGGGGEGEGAEDPSSNQNETTTTEESTNTTTDSAESDSSLGSAILTYGSNLPLINTYANASDGNIIVGGYWNASQDGSQAKPFKIPRWGSIHVECVHKNPDHLDSRIEENVLVDNFSLHKVDYRFSLYCTAAGLNTSFELCGKTYYFQSYEATMTRPSFTSGTGFSGESLNGAIAGKTDICTDLENVDLQLFEYNKGFDCGGATLYTPLSLGAGRVCYTVWDLWGDSTNVSNGHQRTYYLFKPYENHIVTAYYGSIGTLTNGNAASSGSARLNSFFNKDKTVNSSIAEQDKYIKDNGYISRNYPLFSELTNGEGYLGFGYFTSSTELTSGKFEVTIKAKEPSVEGELIVAAVDGASKQTYGFGSEIVYKYSTERKDTIVEEAEQNISIEIKSGELDGLINNNSSEQITIGATGDGDNQSGNNADNPYKVTRRDCLDHTITYKGTASIDYNSEVETNSTVGGAAGNGQTAKIYSFAEGTVDLTAPTLNVVAEPSELVYNMQYVNTSGETIDAATLAKLDMPEKAKSPLEWDSKCSEDYPADGIYEAYRGKDVFTKRFNGETVDLNGCTFGDTYIDSNGGFWVFKGWKTDNSVDVNVNKNDTITSVNFGDSDINVYGTWVYDDGKSIGIVGQVYDGTTSYAETLKAQLGNMVNPDDMTTTYYDSANNPLPDKPEDVGNYTVKVSWTLSDGTTMSLDKDFEIKPQAINEEDKDHYKGITVSQPLTDDGKELAPSTPSDNGTTSDSNEVYYLTYNGTAQVPSISVKNADGSDLGESNYTLSYEDNIYAGTSTVEVTGTGNYAGTVTRTFVIQPAEVKVKTPSAQKVYDGTPLTKDGVELSGGTWYGKEADEGVTLKTTGTITEVGTAPNTAEATFYDGSTLRSASASAATEDSSTNDGGIATQADSATPAISTCYTMSEDDMGTLEILPQSIDPADASSGTYLGITVEAPGDVTYNGSAQTPEPVVKDKNGTVLREGVDYELEYVGDTTNPGTVKVIVKGIGNYSGEVETEYTIKPQTIVKGEEGYNGVTYTAPADVVYNGKEQKSKPVFYDKDGNLLVEGVDYTLEFIGDLTGPGKVKVIATGIGKYTGTIEFEYEILEADEAATTTSVKASTLSQAGDDVGTAAGALGGTALIAGAALLLQRLRRKQN